jgi:iron only hydrogenase large subunit-like protein
MLIGKAQLFCECGYKAEMEFIPISNATCHLKCTNCKEEALTIVYTFRKFLNGKIYLHQEQDFLAYDQKSVDLSVGDTLTVQFKNFVTLTEVSVTLTHEG